MSRRFAVSLCVAIVTIATWAASARAAMLQHYDLASLAFESTHIVRARVVSERKDGHRKVAKHVVIETYAGSMKPGDTFEVERSLYQLDTALPFSQGAVPRGAVLSDEVIVFLVQGHDLPLGIVPSGLRVFFDGAIYRFEQFDNPGPYVPVLQGRDPLDVLGDPAAQKAVTRGEFEADLKVAIARADRARAAVRDPRAHRDELFAMVGPPDGDPTAPVVGSFGLYRDSIAAAAIEAIASMDDLDGVLEALTRIQTPNPHGSFNRKFSSERAIARAFDAKLPIAMRVEAIRLGAMGKVDGPARTALLKLLDAPEPELRIAAALATPASKDDAPGRDAILSRWGKEQDVSVLSALLEVALKNGFANRLPRNDKVDPFVRATRRGRTVSLVWASFRGPEPWGTKRVVVEATTAGKVAGRLVLSSADMLTSWSSTQFGATEFPLRFDPPLQPGTYDLAVSIEMSRGPPGDVATRSVSLALMPVLQPGQVPPLISSPPPLQARAATSVPSTAPAQGGCHCDVGGQRRGGPEIAFVLCVAAAALSGRGRALRAGIASRTSSSRSPSASAASTPPSRASSRGSRSRIGL